VRTWVLRGKTRSFVDNRVVKKAWGKKGGGRFFKLAHKISAGG